MEDIETANPDNSHPTIVELEDVEWVQGSSPTSLILNVGLRFGAPRRDLKGVTVETGVLSARLVIEATNCEIQSKYSNIPSWSDIDLDAIRSNQSSQTRNSEKGASFGLSTIGVKGSQSDQTASGSEVSGTYRTKVVEIESQAGNTWSITNMVGTFLTGLILGHDAPLCIAEIQDDFDVTFVLTTFPGELDVRRLDGESISNQKRKLISAIESKNLGKDRETGAITLSKATIRASRGR